MYSVFRGISTSIQRTVLLAEISMQIDGHSIGWNIGTYLDALDIAAGSLLGEQPEKEGERNEGNNTERMP